MPSWGHIVDGLSADLLPAVCQHTSYRCSTAAHRHREALPCAAEAWFAVAANITRDRVAIAVCPQQDVRSMFFPCGKHAHFKCAWLPV